MEKKLSAQLNYKQETEKNNNVIDFDYLIVNETEDYVKTPDVYVRQDQQNEIDLLWSGMKESQAKQIPPIAYLGIGFVLGLIVAGIIATILLWGTTPPETNYLAPSDTETSQALQTDEVINIPSKASAEKKGAPTNVANSQYNEIVTHTIQSGDSISTIAEKYYGSSAPKFVELIKKSNNLQSVHSITAGKTLVIPVKK